MSYIFKVTVERVGNVPEDQRSRLILVEADCCGIDDLTKHLAASSLIPFDVRTSTGYRSYQAEAYRATFEAGGRGCFLEAVRERKRD